MILNGPPGSEIGTAGFGHPDAGDGNRIWNLAPLIPEERRFSRVYRGRPELIDHTLVSHFPVWTDDSSHDRSAEGALPSIKDNPYARRGKPGSDHAAVIATFNL